MSLCVIIDGHEYDLEDLTELVRWNTALDEAGVDNWEGIEEAITIFNKMVGRQ
jgi:hypothetical protein